DRRAGLLRAADLIDETPETNRGRPPGLADGALPETLDALARTYDQEVPDPGASSTLRASATHPGPIVGFFGKLIPPKGVHLVLQALALQGPEVHGLVVGFGLFREWLEALATALARGDVA